MSAGYMRRCAGKKRHESREQADAARRRKAGGQGERAQKYRSYRCNQCLGWHEGDGDHRMQTRTRRSGKRANKRMRGRL